MQPNVREIDPGRERAEKIESVLRQVVEHLLSEQGVDIGGFAVVGWSMGGRCTSAYMAQFGLVHRGLVPSLVHDALQRHITIDMAADDNTPTTVEPA